MPKPIAIIDVDETLWGFHDAVSATAHELGVKIPKKCDCTSWDAIFKYSTPEEVTKVFDIVHSQQCSYNPYPDADDFLRYMMSRFHVVIASHRKPIYRFELMDWLNINNLLYNEVVVTPDKMPLIKNPRVEVVVDDRDSTIANACKLGKVGVGLRKPWNTNATYTIRANGAERIVSLVLFDSLTEITDFLTHYTSVYKLDKSILEEEFLV